MSGVFINDKAPVDYRDAGAEKLFIVIDSIQKSDEAILSLSFCILLDY